MKTKNSLLYNFNILMFKNIIALRTLFLVWYVFVLVDFVLIFPFRFLHITSNILSFFSFVIMMVFVFYLKQKQISKIDLLLIIHPTLYLLATLYDLVLRGIFL